MVVVRMGIVPIILVIWCCVLPVVECWLSHGPPRSSSNNIIIPSRVHRTSNTRIYGVLSRSVILKHSGSKRGTSKKKTTIGSTTTRPKLTRTFLLEATEEAIYRQQVALAHLESERGKLQQRQEEDDDDSDPEHGNKRTIDPRTALLKMESRARDLASKLEGLDRLHRELQKTRHGDVGLQASESLFRETLYGSSKHVCSILDRPRDNWKRNSLQNREYGRPDGFDGLVFWSPLGVPILVGPPQKDGDSVLRRVAQGSDLWFQVEDYNGSRVLLRTSLNKGTKNSKKCIQMAADLAAYYSVHCDDRGAVPVLYTDSRHVAKRGSKAGRLRKRKSLGKLPGRPCNVQDLIENE